MADVNQRASSGGIALMPANIVVPIVGVFELVRLHSV